MVSQSPQFKIAQKLKPPGAGTINFERLTRHRPLIVPYYTLINTCLVMSLEVDVEAQSARGNSSQAAPSEWSLLKRLSESSHPIATTFFILLRLAPMGVYIFGSWFVKNSVLIFIFVALLVAADFWNVKNISGRLLVGLRWWNESAEDGTSTWVFETADPQRYINPIDSKTFWILIYALPVGWIFLGLLAILKFNVMWLLAVILALVLSLTNTFAFSQCDKFAKANNLIGQVSSSLLSRFAGSLRSRLFT